MSVTVAQFIGFESVHFDAYQERKWASNRFNLERMAVREQSEAVLAHVLSELGEAATDLQLRSSQDHPTIFNGKRVDSQWVLFGSHDEKRKGIKPRLSDEVSAQKSADDSAIQDADGVLFLQVHLEGAAVGLRLHQNAQLDRRNLLNRLANEEEMQAFTDLLTALPSALQLRADGLEAITAAGINGAQVRVWADQLNTSPGMSLSAAFQRDDALLASPEFLTVATSLLASLLPVYRFVAWSTTNDNCGSEFPVPGKDSKEKPPTRTKKGAEKTGANPTRREENWRYRPQWEAAKKDDSKQTPDQPTTPSARARQRKQEMAREKRRSLAATKAPEVAGNRRQQQNEGQGDDSPRKGHRPERAQNKRRNSGGGPPNQPPGKRASERRQGHANHKGRPKRRKEPTYVDSPGELNTLDLVRIEGGLLNGKVGKLVDITSKGNCKVDIGDMVFELARDCLTRVVAQ
jgi:hypothetical protein